MRKHTLKIAAVLFLSTVAGISIAGEATKPSKGSSADADLAQFVENYVVDYCKGLKLPNAEQTSQCVSQGLDIAIGVIEHQTLMLKQTPSGK